MSAVIETRRFFTSKRLHPTAQGKRSATLGSKGGRPQTLKGFHKRLAHAAVVRKGRSTCRFLDEESSAMPHRQELASMTKGMCEIEMPSKIVFVEPFQGSGNRNDVPRVALRLPWADGFNPFRGKGLARELTTQHSRGWSVKQLHHCLRFAEAYPDPEIVYALRRQLSWTQERIDDER